MSARDLSAAPAKARKRQIPERLRKAALFEQLGPGLITGAADDDPSGIATYSQAGAQFGFNMLWTMVLTYPLMTAVQLVSARRQRRQGEEPKAGRSRSASRRGTREGQEKSPQRR